MGKLARQLQSDETEALLDQVVSAFGYPRVSMQGCLRRLRLNLSYVRLYPGDSVHDLLVEEFMRSVWWDDLLQTDEECPYVLEGISQSRLKLAAQWSGFYAYEDGVGFGKSGLIRREERVRYYVDVNPDSDESVILAQLDDDDEPTEFLGVVFTHLDQHREAESEHRFLQTERLRIDEGTLTRESFREQVAGFARRYPYFMSRCGPLLGEDFAVPAVELPRLSDAAARSVDGLSLATFVTRALTTDDAGEVPDRLSELAASERSDDDTVPELLLRPLGRVVMGDHQGAAEAAREILDLELGVPLTRRWARRIVERPEGALLDSET
ncbi:MAG: hypothetical protein VYE22_36330 [Myxococcota bacterium]|nr:hypothetical protein [Myxococcota bacterium]